MVRLQEFPPLTEETRNWLTSFSPGPVFTLLGIRLTGIEPGHSWLEMPFKEEMTHGGGIVQGGILTVLADAAIAFAVRSVLDRARNDQTSIDLKMNFIRPVSSGTMFAEGSVIHLGRKTAVGESIVVNEAGKPVAKCLSSVMILPAGSLPGNKDGHK